MTSAVEDRPIQRMTQVRAQMVKDGVRYMPGGERPWVPVDAATYLDLLAIDAITPTPWESLEPEPRGGPPAVLADV